MAFNIDYTVCIVLMAILTAIYVIAGGYMATAINDFIQGIIMLFGIVIVIAAVLDEQGWLYGTRSTVWHRFPDPAASAQSGRLCFVLWSRTRSTCSALSS